ncbi:MAG: hypothetical protein MHPSP_003025, partial [Paramarteilia canceri]
MILPKLDIVFLCPEVINEIGLAVVSHSYLPFYTVANSQNSVSFVNICDSFRFDADSQPFRYYNCLTSCLENNEIPEVIHFTIFQCSINSLIISDLQIFPTHAC